MSELVSGFLKELGHSVYAEKPADQQAVLTEISGYYARAHAVQGPLPQTLLWPSTSGQKVRFGLLADLMAHERWRAPVTVNDFGCAYGGLFSFLARRWRGPRIAGYVGYDICDDLLTEARRRIPDPRARFLLAADVTEEADYSFASGTFGLRMDTPSDTWRDWTFTALETMAAHSRKGFAFNMIDASAPYADSSGMYLADVETYLDFCTEAFDAEVTYTDRAVECEWTMYVRFRQGK